MLTQNGWRRREPIYNMEWDIRRRTPSHFEKHPLLHTPPPSSPKNGSIKQLDVFFFFFFLFLFYFCLYEYIFVVFDVKCDRWKPCVFGGTHSRVYFISSIENIMYVYAIYKIESCSLLLLCRKMFLLHWSVCVCLHKELFGLVSCVLPLHWICEYKRETM